jgi:hypothetical protein
MSKERRHSQHRGEKARQISYQRSISAPGVSYKLKQNDEWQMELLNENRKPVFRITLIAETLDR